MSGWIFVKGRETETALPDVTTAGAASIALTDADQLFSAGQQLFISEADGSETQWLGRVVGVDAAGIEFSRPLAKSKNSGALLWRAADALVTHSLVARPAQHSISTGVAAERSLGGQWIAMQVAQPREDLRLTLAGLTPADYQSLVAWLSSAVQWGLVPFTLIDPSGNLLAVRLTGEPLRRTQESGGQTSMELPLSVIEEGGYQ